MDMLEDIFSRQKAFDDMLVARRQLPDWTPEEWTQKEAVAILCELAEVIEETNYRWWKNPRPVSREKVVGEMVDILHFFTALCLKWGVTAQELHGRYVEKNQENFDRQYGRTEREGYDVTRETNAAAEDAPCAGQAATAGPGESPSAAPNPPAEARP